jgi:hypothetical protein
MESGKPGLLKSLFCCEEYAKRTSNCCDGRLCLFQKIAHFFHHCLCFTCRRFSSQLSIVDCACKKVLNDKPTDSCCMSKEAKERIKKNLENTE